MSTDVQSNTPDYPPSAWLARVGWTAPVLADSADSEAAAAWGLRSFPYLVALRADGTVAARGVGELTLDEVRTLVAAATAGHLAHRTVTGGSQLGTPRWPRHAHTLGDDRPPDDRANLGGRGGRAR